MPLMTSLTPPDFAFPTLAYVSLSLSLYLCLSLSVPFFARSSLFYNLTLDFRLSHRRFFFFFIFRPIRLCFLSFRQSTKDVRH